MNHGVLGASFVGGLAAAGVLLTSCSGSTPEATVTASKNRVVHGAVVKGPLAGASVDFFLVDSAGALTGSPLVSSVTTDAAGGFTVAGLPAGAPGRSPPPPGGRLQRVRPRRDR